METLLDRNLKSRKRQTPRRGTYDCPQSCLCRLLLEGCLCRLLLGAQRPQEDQGHVGVPGPGSGQAGPLCPHVSSTLHCACPPGRRAFFAQPRGRPSGLTKGLIKLGVYCTSSKISCCWFFFFPREKFWMPFLLPVRGLYITKELKHKNKIVPAEVTTKLSSWVLLPEPWHLLCNLGST